MLSAISSLLLLAAVIIADAQPWNDEQRLVRDLWEVGRYDAATRPVKNVSHAVEVTLQVDVFGILSLDSKEQLLTASAAFIMSWQDDRLRWESADYSGIEHVYVPASSVWYPPIEVLNAFGETKLITENTKVLITHEGALYVARSQIQKTQCSFKQELFPFDQQNCSYVIGTVNVPSGMVWIEASKVDTQRDEVKSIENWDLVDFEVSWTVSPSCITFESPETCERTSQAVLTVTLKRESGFYMYTVFIPCSILTLIASVIFWLPVECGEKLSFGISIFFGFVIFQLILQDALVDAGNGKPSILLRYVLFNFILVGLAVMVTAASIALHHKGDPVETPRCTGMPGTTAPEQMAEYALNKTCDEDNLKNLQTKKPRDWRKIARYLDRVCFVLYYLSYIIVTAILFAEVAQFE